MTDSTLTLLLALIALASRLVDLLRDKWDTLHRKE
jgi:hypothetical protein